MKTEEDIRGYDPLIIRRLLGYLKPYMGMVSIAVVALLIATAAELLVPVVLQRTIDQHITVSHRRVALSAIEDPEWPLSRVEVFGSAPMVGDWFFVRDIDLVELGVDERERLEEQGLIDSESWYVFPISDDLRYLLQLKQGLFELDSRSRMSGTPSANVNTLTTADSTNAVAYGAIRIIDIDRLSREERRLLRGSDIDGVFRASSQVFVLLLSILVFSFVQVYLMAYTGQSVMKAIRIKLFRHTIGLSSGFLQTRPVGSLVTRVTSDVETLNELFSNVATSLVKDVCMIAGVVATMLLLDSRLALVAFATVPPIIVATMLFRTRARNAYRRVRSSVSRVNAFLSERISGMAVVQLFAAEKRSARVYDTESSELLHANIREVKIMALFRPLVDLFTSVSVGVVLYYGAGLAIREAVSLGVLIAFINLIGKFYRPIQDISEKFTVLQSAMAGGERVFALLDTSDRIPDVDEPDRHDSIALSATADDSDTKTDILSAGSVRFDSVTFGYDPKDPVLKELSFSVQPGEKIAIVGFTGAGKTTIINLLTRLWDIQKGSILLDEKDVRSLPIADLRTMVQPVQQDVFLFAGNIEDNIRLGRDISHEAVVDAAKAVNAIEFIEKLSHGFQTPVQEAGSNLSTGQRQLISFARVIAGNPGVIVLDEATSSVDTETERLIQRGIEALLAGRTSLTIAHRLSTIRDSDRILVLSKGRLVETGSHDELLAKGGTYTTLYKLQYAAEKNQT